MGRIFNLVGDDTFLINDIPLIADTAHGEVVSISFPNELVTVTTGKNKNTIYAKNEAGSQVDIECKLMRGSKGDRFLNGLLANQENDFIAFNLMNGAFVKRMGNGQGKVTYDTYTITGMVFTNKPGTTSNTEGEADQATITYTLKGALATRGIL